MLIINAVNIKAFAACEVNECRSETQWLCRCIGPLRSAQSLQVHVSFALYETAWCSNASSITLNHCVTGKTH